MTIEELYEKEKDQEDGFLYIKYSNMEPFGAKPWKVLQRELDLYFCIYLFFKEIKNNHKYLLIRGYLGKEKWNYFGKLQTKILDQISWQFC